MAVHWNITDIYKDPDNQDAVHVNGYSVERSKNTGRHCILETIITKTNPESFLKNDFDCHEGYNCVMVNPKEGFIIQVSMISVEDADVVEKFHSIKCLPKAFTNLIDIQRKIYEGLLLKDSIDCFQAIVRNKLWDEHYFGLPPIVCMTWLGMIVADI